MNYDGDTRVFSDLELIYSQLSSKPSRCRFTAYRQLYEKNFPLKETMAPKQWSNFMHQVHYGLLDAMNIKQAWDILSNCDSILGLEEKFIKAMRSGVTLPRGGTGEGMHSSSLDDAFEILVAADIVKSGVPLYGFGDQSKGEVDIFLGNKTVGVECKRPRSKKTLLKHVKKACRQIEGDANLRRGFIALETSFMQNQKDAVAHFRGEDSYSDAERSAGFLVDTFCIDIAAEIAGRFRSGLVDQIRVYYQLPAVADNCLMVQSASSDIFITTKGRFIPIMYKPIMIMRKLPKLVIPVFRDKAPEDFIDFRNYLETLK